MRAVTSAVLVTTFLAFAKLGVALGTGANDLKISLADAPSVKLHVTFKRKSMKLHGQPEFDMFANPVVSADGASVLYDGYVAFEEDDSTFTYSYVNGSGYLSTKDGDRENVQCISSSTLPFNSILPALNDARPIPSATIGDETIECPSGNLFKTNFGGTHFAICASGKSGFAAYSSDMTIDVEYLENSVSISKPTLSCAAVGKEASVSPTALALLTGKEVPASSTRNLKAAEHMAMESSSCTCKSTPRPCVFFHGIGNYNEMEELQDTPKKASGRMGNMNAHAPCCTEVKYSILNTMDYSWTNDSLQQKFCDRALRLSDTSDVDLGVVKDTVVVTHSMGGLVMSMALATGRCSFGEGASWVALSSPMMGSMASDYFQDFCNDEVSDFATDLLDVLGQCPMPVARQSLFYQNEKYSTVDHNAAYKAAQEAYRGNVSAAMCSDDYRGIFSVYRPIMVVAGKLVPHKSSENDGLVEFQSCAKGIETAGFGNSFKDQFYVPELNHADTVFLNGDGIFKDSRKPVKWFECLL
uniref:AB hydrolase-1 domain-containing protein n=1 Tax=Phytophthora ramorum TaxID=164328 RepID=H3GWF4_PHYRM